MQLNAARCNLLHTNAYSYFHKTRVNRCTEDFAGRVLNPPSVNTTTAGNTIPIPFSLSVDKWLNNFAPNSPSSQQAKCSTWAPIGAASPTTAAPPLAITRGQYTYYWTTAPAWAGTCRVFAMTLRGGTTRILNFSFLQ